MKRLIIAIFYFLMYFLSSLSKQICSVDGGKVKEDSANQFASKRRKLNPKIRKLSQNFQSALKFTYLHIARSSASSLANIWCPVYHVILLFSRVIKMISKTHLFTKKEQLSFIVFAYTNILTWFSYFVFPFYEPKIIFDMYSDLLFSFCWPLHKWAFYYN